MTLQKFRWSQVYESSEEELLVFLQARNIEFAKEELEPFVETDEKSHQGGITLWCAEGSFTVTVSNNRLSMQPGDALRIPANTTFVTAAGISGCVIYQTPQTS